MLLQLFVLWLIPVWGTFVQNFYGNLQLDELIYVAVNIPPNSKSVEIHVWAEQSKYSPILLMRYDGPPSMAEYDEKLEIPSLPDTLILIDSQPTSSVLYLALWGGVLPHSYRYFAGSPEMLLVGVESFVDSCQSDLQKGDDCQFQNMLTLKSDTIVIDTSISPNSKLTYLLPVPMNTEGFSLDLLLDLKDVCKESGAAKWVFSVDAYLDQPLEEENAGRRYVDIDTSKLCASDKFEQELKLFAERPAGGMWTMVIDLSIHDQRYLSSQIMRLNDLGQSDRHVLDEPLPVGLAKPVPLTISTLLLACPSGRTGHLNTSTHSMSSCDTPIYDMNSARASSTSLSLTSADAVFNISTPVAPAAAAASQTPLPAELTVEQKNAAANQEPFLLFMGLLRPSGQEIPVGGGMQIQLLIQPKEHVLFDGKRSEEWTYTDFLAYFDRFQFNLGVRIDGLPENPDVYPELYEGRDREQWNVQSMNAMVLTTRDAKIVDQYSNALSSWLGWQDDDDNDNGDDRTGSGSGIHSVLRRFKYIGDVRNERMFVWTIDHPMLPNVNRQMDNRLFVRVSREPAMYEHHHPQQQQQRYNVTDDSLLVSVKVLFMPCPPDTCVHGTCFTRAGDIQTSVCMCKYPWAGEACDELSTSYWFYVVQVLALVLSNLAMVPGIVLSVLQDLPLFTALLSFASMSSAFYHLCDTDVYCVAGLSFQSLQVLDILFCTVCMASMILYYAPMSRDMHVAFTITSIGMLVSPISNSPTNAWNILGSMAGAFTVSFLFWLWMYIGPNMMEKCSCCYALCSRMRPANGKIIHHSQQQQPRRQGTYAKVSTHEFDFSSVVLDDGDEEEESIELATLNFHENSVTSPRSNSILAADIRNGYDSYLQCLISNLRYCYVRKFLLFYSVLGVASALTGLYFFGNQTRDNYWIFHSCWHVFVMLSSFLLLYGHADFMTFMNVNKYR